MFEEMRRRSPYWLRSSAKRAPRRRSATVVRRYFLRQRPTVRETHSPGLLSPPCTLRSRIRKQSEKTKANWDFHKTRVLLTIAASIIDNGHRRGSCLSQTGYNQLLTDFNRITSQTLTISQIKSRMVQLGKDWQAWMDFKNPTSRVTRMGWNSETNTWDAHDWRCASQQQRNPHADLMEKIFGGSTATREWHWTPSARTPPHKDAQGLGMQGQAEFVASSGPPLVANHNRQSDGPDGSGLGGVRRREGDHDETDDSYSNSRHCQSHVDRMIESIANMADAIRGRTNEIRLVWGASQNSMQNCIAKLLAMEAVDSTSELYLFAIDLFTTEVNREAFMAQPDDAHRMRWLLYQQRKHEQMQCQISSVPPYPYYPLLGPNDASKGFFPP